MKILVETAEAIERFEELIELVERGDDIVVFRDGTPIAEMKPVPKGTELWDELWATMDAERANVPVGTTSDHDDLYDEHGLPR